MNPHLCHLKTAKKFLKIWQDMNTSNFTLLNKSTKKPAISMKACNCTSCLVNGGGIIRPIRDYKRE